MIDWSWILMSWTDALMVILSALGIYVALIIFTRMVGLRSFSKMSSFDFAITVAFGTILAGTVYAENPPLLQGILSLGALFGIQYVVAKLRPRSHSVSEVVDNAPMLLMAGSEILHDNLKVTRLTEGDLKAKLREANVIDYSQVRAVVMESTGDVSVLHAAEDGLDLNLDLLVGVRGLDRLEGTDNVYRDESEEGSGTGNR